jgi:tRNA 2-selenouridine synthase
MVSIIKVENIFQLSLPVIDVRSPGEFEKGHIPGAVNIPLFSDVERAHVGTVYKQESKESAVELGYKYVEPKLRYFIIKSISVAPLKKAIVHCWRGGMRSQAFAKHLSDNGFVDVKIVEGGYKSYRNFVLNSFEKSLKLKVLGGYTGSGKTYILKELADNGEQVIDLEYFANHKGSAFGGIDKGLQPTVEQFENNLHAYFLKLDFNKEIWIEDESHSIGSVKIPMPIYRQIRNSRLFFLNIPISERAKHLVEEYSVCNSRRLVDSIHRIAKRIGYDNEKKAVDFLEKKCYYEVALIALSYYDKSYKRGMNARTSDVKTIELATVNHKENTKILLIKN